MGRGVWSGWGPAGPDWPAPEETLEKGTDWSLFVGSSYLIRGIEKLLAMHSLSRLSLVVRTRHRMV
jgi:hypothetical protein